MRLALCFVGLVASTEASAIADERPQTSAEKRVTDEDPSGTLGLSLGAGTNGFIGAAARAVIGPGVAWEARLTTLDNRHVRAELSYVGSTQDAIDAPDVSLRSHGVQGTLRINVAPSLPVEPFFYIGVGVSRLTVTNNDGSFGGTDYVLDNPFGLGAAYHFGKWVVDLRAAVSVETGAQIVSEMDSMDNANLNRFSLRASLGAEL